MTQSPRFTHPHRYGLPLAVALLSGCAGMATEGTDTTSGQAQAEQATVAAESPAAKDAGSTRESVRIFKGTGALVKAPSPERAPGGGNVSLNFEAADVRDIAKTVLSEILKESYIVDPKVGGTISFRTVKPLAKEALLPTLETILRLNGIVLVKENGIYKIMPGAAVKGSLSPRMGSSLSGFGVQVVPLKYIGSREMAKILEGFAADPAAVKADELRNLLLLAGTQNELQHMLDTIDMFDVDWLSGMSIGMYTLQSADVKTVDTELTKILGDKNANPFAGVLRVIPLERLNAFVIITPQPHYLEQAKIWLERLDRAGGTGGTTLHVYHVQNGKAEHLAELLNQTFGGNRTQGQRTTNPTVAPGLTGTEIRSDNNRNTTTPLTSTGNRLGGNTGTVGGATLAISDESGTSEVRVVADKETNSLLILANQAGYDKIANALKRLDEPPRQVLIEVMIVEVTLGDDFSLGVEWSIASGSRKKFQLDNDKTSGIGAILPGFAYTLTDPTGTGVKAVLNMLAGNSKVNVLSSPHIMVADNQTAKIQVGESLPISQSLLNGTTTVNSTSYLDTGVILSVTPRINAGGLVSLDIDQEFSVPGTVASGSTAPPINKRSAKTRMTAQSGETMVLGGMISEKSTNSSAGLPFLSSIPVLGGLFGSTDRSVTKTELIVLITPRVANNVGQAKAISDELRRKMGEAKDLVDCGTANLVGYTSRGGLWCIQPGRLEGTIDRMNQVDANGQPIYTLQRPSLPPEDFNLPHPKFQKSMPAATPAFAPMPATAVAPAITAPSPAAVTAPAQAKPATTPAPAAAAAPASAPATVVSPSAAKINTAPAKPAPAKPAPPKPAPTDSAPPQPAAQPQ